MQPSSILLIAVTLLLREPAKHPDTTTGEVQLASVGDFAVKHASHYVSETTMIPVFYVWR